MKPLEKLKLYFEGFTRSLGVEARTYYQLVFPSAFDLPLQQKRVIIIQSRIRSLAWILAIGMPTWSLLDAFIFTDEIWVSILVARLLAGAAFGSFLLLGTVFLKHVTRNLWPIYLQLAILFIVPTLFYIFCHRPPQLILDSNPWVAAITNIYYLLPLIILACIGFFPFTLMESLSIAVPFLAVYYLTNRDMNLGVWSSELGMVWTMIVLAAISIVVSYSQLRLLVQLVNFSSYDMLTECLGRRSGEEITRILWHHSVRQKTNLSIAFIDLDHFKWVNDCFGHQVGDTVLANTAAAIKKALRKSDFVIRWGGEEFLVIMPDANIENASHVLMRMAQKGLTLRPDGSPQTVSIGVAERLHERIDDESLLIQIADERLYQAKIAGRCRVVGLKTTVLG